MVRRTKRNKSKTTKRSRKRTSKRTSKRVSKRRSRRVSRKKSRRVSQRRQKGGADGDASLFSAKEIKELNEALQQIQDGLHDVYGEELAELGDTCRPITTKELERMGLGVPMGASGSSKKDNIRRGVAFATTLLQKYGVGAAVCILGFIFPKVASAAVVVDRIFPQIKEKILNSVFLLTAMFRVLYHNAKTVGRSRMAVAIGADFSDAPAEFLLLKKLKDELVVDAITNKIDWNASRGKIKSLSNKQRAALFDTVMANAGM